MKLWTFHPDEPYVAPARKAYRPRKKGEPATNWCAPEHVRLAQDMKRDYPRDHNGVRIEGKPRELVIDPRPRIMVPERQTRMGYK